MAEMDVHKELSEDTRSTPHVDIVIANSNG